MGFVLKKWLGNLLMPLPLLLLLMALALLLLWFSRWQKSAKGLLTVSWGLLLLLSLQPMADHFLASLENQYPTYHGQQPIDYIAVLGGGYTFNPAWAPSSNLINNSLARVTEGVRLYHLNPTAKLVFSGRKEGNNLLSNAETAALVAEGLGVPKQAIIHLDSPKDTEEEAIAYRQLIGDKPFLLVTSANHLPRAMLLFHQQGLNPIPAPANQMAIKTIINPWDRWLPDAIWLSHTQNAWHETLGRGWLWLKDLAHTR